MKFLITGATGFIGSHVVQRARAAGHEVHGISRTSEGLNLHRCGDAASDLLPIMRSVKPDVVVHLASLFVAEHKASDIDSLISSNISFGVHLADAMATCDVRRLVNAGTSWQHFGSDVYNPVCLYAATKQAFEDILKFYAETSALSIVTLKLFDTYGPGDTRAKLMPLLQKMAGSGQTLGMSGGEQLIDLVYIDDVVDAVMTACELTGEISGMNDFPVSSGNPISLKSLAGIYSRVTGRELQIEWGARAYRKREVMKPWRGRHPLPGWRPKVSLEEGIRRTEAYHV